MFGKRFKKLINSDRYQKSDYLIQKINGFYVLKIKDSGKYVDLSDTVYSWRMLSHFFIYCQSRFKWRVIKAFNCRVPVIKPIKEMEKLTKHY